LKKQKGELLNATPKLDYEALAKKLTKIKDIYHYALKEERKQIW